MIDIVVIAHNIRSCHNIGSLFRTCDGLGIKKIYLTGYSPYPKQKGDARLPHLASKIHTQIQKTALGAEESMDWEYQEQVSDVISRIKQEKSLLIALEQSSNSQPLTGFKSPDSVTLLLGNEVDGLEPEVLNQADITLEIPMFGRKESYNVVVAAAMALYQFRFL